LETVKQKCREGDAALCYSLLSFLLCPPRSVNKIIPDDLRSLFAAYRVVHLFVRTKRLAVARHVTLGWDIAVGI
jgi:hypothetical protein